MDIAVIIGQWAFWLLLDCKVVAEPFKTVPAPMPHFDINVIKN